jgi:hypothetical protein
MIELSPASTNARVYLNIFFFFETIGSVLSSIYYLLHAAHPGSEAIEANKFVRFDSPSNI